MERLDGAYLKQASRLIGISEEGGGDAAQLGGFRVESRNERNEPAQDVLTVGPGSDASEQFLAVRREPLGVLASGFLDDIGSEACDDPVIVIEGGDEAADQCGIRTYRGEGTGRRRGAPAADAFQALEQCLAAAAGASGFSLFPASAPLCSTMLLLPGPFLRPVVRCGLGAV